jgi:hypothetical protein
LACLTESTTTVVTMDTCCDSLTLRVSAVCAQAACLWNDFYYAWHGIFHIHSKTV